MSKLVIHDRKIMIPVELMGYSTYVGQLARIFNVNHNTLRQRLKGGWEVEAALIANSRDGWTAATSHVLARLPSTTALIKRTLQEYFESHK